MYRVAGVLLSLPAESLLQAVKPANATTKASKMQVFAARDFEKDIKNPPICKPIGGVPVSQKVFERFPSPTLLVAGTKGDSQPVGKYPTSTPSGLCKNLFCLRK